MARINADLATQREWQVYLHFLWHADETPEAAAALGSARAYNARLAADYGFRMNLARLYEIVRAARGGASFPSRPVKQKGQAA